MFCLLRVTSVGACALRLDLPWIYGEARGGFEITEVASDLGYEINQIAIANPIVSNFNFLHAAPALSHCTGTNEVIF